MLAGQQARVYQFMIRKILKAILVLIGILILVLLGLYLIPPSQQSFEYESADIERNPLINNKVGWYTGEDGKEYQISWGAKQGLQLNYFDFDRENLKQFQTKAESHLDQKEKSIETLVKPIREALEKTEDPEIRKGLFP